MYHLLLHFTIEALSLPQQEGYPGDYQNSYRAGASFASIRVTEVSETEIIAMYHNSLRRFSIELQPIKFLKYRPVGRVFLSAN
jgi:hypothetical protein